MKQWRAMRDTLPANVLLLFRLGDFYELFSKDADDAAMITGLGLTRRNGVSMCGFPVHAAPEYIRQLIKAGRKVAIAEQTEAPVPGKLTERQIREAGEPEGVPAALGTPLARLREILSRRRGAKKEGGKPRLLTVRQVADSISVEDLRALANLMNAIVEAEIRQSGCTAKRALAVRRAISWRHARETKMERFRRWLHGQLEEKGSIWVTGLARTASAMFTGITRAKILQNIPSGFCLRWMDNGGGKRQQLAIVRGTNLPVEKLVEQPLPFE